MKSYQSALTTLYNNKLLVKNEKVILKKVLNRISAEDVFSPINYPTSDNTAFDGFALLAKETKGLSKKKVKKFKILKSLAAGDNPKIKNYQKNSSIEVMTGAIIPKPFNAIIPVEKVKYFPSKKKPTHIVVDDQIKKFKNNNLDILIGINHKEYSHFTKISEKVRTALTRDFY